MSSDLGSLLEFMIMNDSPEPDAVRPSVYWSKAGVDGRWPNMARVFHWLHNLVGSNVSPPLKFPRFLSTNI